MNYFETNPQWCRTASDLYIHVWYQTSTDGNHYEYLSEI